MLKALVTGVAVCAASAALSDAWPDTAKLEGVWRLQENSLESCVKTPLVVEYDKAGNRLSASLRWTDDPNLWGNLTITILSEEGAVMSVRRDSDSALGVITMSLDGSSFRAAFHADTGATSTYLRCADSLANS